MGLAGAVLETEVTGLTADSRAVGPGNLFAALPGSRADGRAFIPQAIAKGAAAILAPPGTEIAGIDTGGQPSGAKPAVLITDENPRRRLALMAASFHQRQPHNIAVVTGTNGKTSVAEFTRQIWTLLGLRAASLGTLGLLPARAGAPASLTTPDPVELHRCLALLAREGTEHLALEASSHGLDQYRLDGVRVTAAAFTNLSRDHLDYHGSMAAYLAAKQRLFAEILQAEGTAVLNADVPEIAGLVAACGRRGIKVFTYGHAGRELRLLDQRLTPAGQVLTLELFGVQYEAPLSLAGSFQAANVLAALGLVIASGCEAAQAINCLAGLTGVPGRVEPVGQTPKGGAVYVDYAHTPDALDAVLTAMRPHCKGSLWVVCGAGGDRDRGKRPQMGAAAQRRADKIIVTDDNPRGEDPAAIRQAVLAATTNATEIGDRGEAIAQAVAAIGPGDVLVIAGKGHESGQVVGGRTLPFDDRDVARAAIAALRETAGNETPGKTTPGNKTAGECPS